MTIENQKSMSSDTASTPFKIEKSTYLQAQYGDSDPSTLSLERLIGCWKNTNDESGGIRTARIEQEGEELVLYLVDGPQGQTRAWPPCKINTLFADNHHANVATAFLADVDVYDQSVQLEANINLGLLIIASVHQPVDAPGYFAREFYYLEDDDES